MKIIIKIFLAINIILPVLIYGQSEVAKCKIAVVARYTNAGAELRWIPNNKTILRLGFANSYTIERSVSGSDKFEAIATVKPLSGIEWEKLIANEKDTVVKSDLEMADDFLFTDEKSQQNNFSLNKGIAALNEQKNIEDMEYAVFVMATIKDGKAAQALGLGFIDKTVKEGETYIYKVKLNASSDVYEIEDGEVTLKMVKSADKYKNKVFVYPGDKKLSFAWSAKPELSGYYVQRAEEGDTAFKPLNTTPFYASKGSGFDGPANGSFMDDSLTNYKTYRYRFYGTTAFGERVLFAEAEGMPRDLTPPDNPIIKQPKQINANQVQVGWNIFGDLSDLRGFIVARSEKDSGDFKVLHKTLLPKNSRSYIDSTFDHGGTNYYVVYAIDTAGNLSASYPAYAALVDSTPPAKPIISSAIIDSAGVVTLTVKLGKEKDLKGYRLFKANSPNHEFSVIEEAFKKDKSDTTSIKTVFVDTVTLNSLTPKIYYRVKALDFNFNQSEFSDVAEVVRPDTIPPVTPVFKNVIVTDKYVRLYFAPSSSKDVKEHFIYRRTSPDSAWQIIAEFDSNINEFNDTSVATGITYYYTMRAKDMSGLYSKYSHPVYGKPYDTGVRPGVENLTADVKDKNIVLSWDYPASVENVAFIIYKKNDKGSLVQYDLTKQKNYTDKNTGKKNYYSVKAVTADGGQSHLSMVVGKEIEK